MLELDEMVVIDSSTVELLYGFKGEIWPDAAFNIRVDNMFVSAISLDD